MRNVCVCVCFFFFFFFFGVVYKRPTGPCSPLKMLFIETCNGAELCLVGALHTHTRTHTNTRASIMPPRVSAIESVGSTGPGRGRGKGTGKGGG